MNKVLPLALIADDDSMLRLIMRTTVEQLGFEVAECADAPEVMPLLAERRPDLILLDVDMPGGSGLELCAQIRARKELANVPVVMVTGHDDVASVADAFNRGASDFIAKPINWALFSRRLGFVLRASQAFQEVQASQIRQQAMLEAIPDAIFRLDANAVLVDCHVGQGASALAGCAEKRGRPLREALSSDKAAAEFDGGVEAVRGTGQAQSFEIRIGGGEDAHDFEVRLVESGGGELLALLRDITQRKANEAYIRFIANHDQLTGLLNRFAFSQEIERSAARARRGGYSLAVLFVGLHKIRSLNELLGHEVGDQFLRHMSAQLLRILRQHDLVARLEASEGEEPVARFSGDEFCILLPKVEHAKEAESVALRLLDSLRRPVTIGGHEIVAVPSVGVSLYPDDALDGEILLRYASTAMHQAQDKRDTSLAFYSASLTERALERAVLERDLRRALDRGEFVLYYQPKICTTTGKAVGAEALIRWNHPERGLIPPLQFIGLAEETRLIVPIGAWVIEEAARQLGQWRTGPLSHIRIAVNVSTEQFQSPGLIDRLEEALGAGGAAPGSMEIEVTESLMFQDSGVAAETLRGLSRMGVRLSLDDFGTGYSSLSYLHRLPLSTLKIDASFVRGLTTQRNNASIVRAVIAMAHELGMTTVAEGVETREQADYLMRQGCDELQGYLFSRPLPADDFERYCLGI